MEKISGFSLVRNGTAFDYPYLESWQSLLPMVDELVLNIGKSDDDTLERAREFQKNQALGKIKIIETLWPLHDPEKKKSGLILSEQTNIALQACENDWCFYLQADEVLHEEDYPKIKQAIQRAVQEKSEIEAIVFEYAHFYGSFNVIQKTRSAYRREMRVVKKSSGAVSIGDAQSFRKSDGKKLNALLTDARIFHYGWVRTPAAMREKTKFMDQLYHGDQDQHSLLPHSGENYLYKRFWGLKNYLGTHPAVMQLRIREKGWNWNLKKSPFVYSLSDVKKTLLDLYERFTGHRPFEFKNYVVKGKCTS